MSARKRILAAVQQDGERGLAAAVDFQNDREVVLVAVKKDGWAMQHAAWELRSCREFVMSRRALAPAVTIQVGRYRYSSFTCWLDRFGCQSSLY